MPETPVETPSDEAGADFIVDAATDEVLRIHLDVFRGPFEVLLYLIKSQEIDIFDIPIAKITDQYLHFLELMEEENIDIAGEYLVMAATLIQIKSKMILPVEEDDDEEIDEEDPRLELVEKLIEYRKYKDVAARLSELEEERINWFTRNAKPEFDDIEEEVEFIEATLFDLSQAFKGVMRFIADEQPHTVEMEEASVDERIEYIENLLARHDTVAWGEIFALCRSRIELVCSFLAILELCRMGRIRAYQHRTFGDIRLLGTAEQNVA